MLLKTENVQRLIEAGHRMSDGGPMYTETDLSQWIVEPFNAISAIPFIVIALYWFFKVAKRFRQHSFLWVASLVLLIGGVGGTIYHAFRISRFFLVMDYMPIAILAYSASVFYLVKTFGSRWYVFALVPGFFFLQFLCYRFLPPYIAINVSYFLLAVFVLTPVFLYLRKTRYANRALIIGALVSFGLALFFRSVDHLGWIPIGTHFLWHTFGALAAYCMFAYVYRTNEPLVSGPGQAPAHHAAG